MATTGIGAKKARTKTKRGRLAVPPPDDPLQRHQELNRDRRIGSEDQELGKLRLAAIEYLRRMPEAEAEAPVAPMPGTSNWVQMGPTAIPKGQTYSPARVLVTGRVTSIVVDPVDHNILYIGAAQGGVWKTTDNGKNWIPKTDNEVSLATGALAMDPTNHLVLYAGTGEGNFSGDSYYGNGVLKTTNGGSTWTLQGAATFAGARFSRIVINPVTPNTVFAATGNGIYRTTNGGANWSLLAGLPAAPATDVVIDPVTPATVYAAFWGQGIYRSTNANAAVPAWTKLAGGLPAGGFSRIALGISPSAPQRLYALIADVQAAGYSVNRFYGTNNGGNNWSAIPLPGGSIGGQGFYNLNVAVDPTTPDILYLSAISLWKAVRNAMNNTWTITDIGGSIHPDNHALAFDPANHLVIYAGNDGGIYRSTNGGTTWDDRINEGLCITQFEFMEQHPTSDAVVFAGTQDNGTEQFRNSPVFNHADDGDGGFVAIDPNQPKNILSSYYLISPKRSTLGGKFGTWSSVAAGLSGNALFYPPFTLDQTNPNNIAFGTDQIFLSPTQGVGGWPTSVTLPGLGVGERVSAVSYVNSSLIYAGTENGKVYRLTKAGVVWTATKIGDAPALPQRFIWDVAPRPGNPNTVIVVMSGFGTAHVWRGVVPVAGATVWTDISGVGAGRLPDIPVNALAIEPNIPDTMYIATDVAVFRTTNGGTTWGQFSSGLPNCAVFDMKLHAATRLLRVVTHGRGMWERKLDTLAMPDVNIFVRDHLMDTGRFTPSPGGTAAFEDPLQHVALGDAVAWWQCADIKVDALEGFPPAYQMSVSAVDYVAYESQLAHRNAQRGRVNRVYVQLHNRGIQPATNVTVKLLYANASAGLPNLPADFWAAYPGNSADLTHWKPIGAAKVIASLSPVEPTVLEWDWSTPATAADHTCLLAVINCAGDPIPAANKVFDVNALVRNEKRVGLKNLHVVDAVPGAFYWTPFNFFGQAQARTDIRVSPSTGRGWNLGLLFPKDSQKDLKLDGVTTSKPTKAMLTALREKIGTEIDKYDTAVLYTVAEATKGGQLGGVKLPKGALRAMLLLLPPDTSVAPGKVSIEQTSDQQIIGGSAFVLRTAKG